MLHQHQIRHLNVHLRTFAMKPDIDQRKRHGKLKKRFSRYKKRPQFCLCGQNRVPEMIVYGKKQYSCSTYVNFSCVRLILNTNSANVTYALLQKGVISNIIWADQSSNTVRGAVSRRIGALLLRIRSSSLCGTWRRQSLWITRLSHRQ